MKADKEMIAKQLFRLSTAFPDQKKEFFELLFERMMSYEYSENELIESINNVIDTFEYKTLTVASILKAKNEQKRNNTVEL